MVGGAFFINNGDVEAFLLALLVVFVHAVGRGEIEFIAGGAPPVALHRRIVLRELRRLGVVGSLRQINQPKLAGLCLARGEGEIVAILAEAERAHPVLLVGHPPRLAASLPHEVKLRLLALAVGQKREVVARRRPLWRPFVLVGGERQLSHFACLNGCQVEIGEVLVLLPVDVAKGVEGPFAVVREVRRARPPHPHDVHELHRTLVLHLADLARQRRTRYKYGRQQEHSPDRKKTILPHFHSPDRLKIFEQAVA